MEPSDWVVALSFFDVATDGDSESELQQMEEKW